MSTALLTRLSNLERRMGGGDDGPIRFVLWTGTDPPGPCAEGERRPFTLDIRRACALPDDWTPGDAA